MKRLAVLLAMALALTAAFLLWRRSTSAERALHPAEVFRRRTAAAFSSEFSLGIARNAALPRDDQTLRTNLDTLARRHISLVCLSGPFPSPAGCTPLTRACKRAGIRLILDPAWSSLPPDIATAPEKLPAAVSALEKFWTALQPKPAALLLGQDLADNAALPAYGRYGISATTQRIPAFPTVNADAAESFARLSPASPVLFCRMPLDAAATTSPDFSAFLENGRTAVTAATKAGMTPLFLIPDTGKTPPATLSWMLWASVALGARGVLHTAPDSPWMANIPSAFDEIASFRSLLRTVEPCEDFLGLTPLLNVVYPGDMARLFHDRKKNRYWVAVVLSPLRPAGTPVTLRGGSFAPLEGSPALAALRPGHGGWYQAPLSPAAVAAMNEARSLTRLARAYRDELFVPTYGSGYAVLADASMAPRLLHCSEPVALLVNPNIVLEAVDGSRPPAQPPARNHPAFRKAHVSGHTLHRIKTVDRYRRLVILEEDGSAPGYNERVAALANVGVTHNGIQPQPVKSDSNPLPAEQCHLLYDLDAFRNVSGLNLDYPLYFQFDGGNTAGQPDTRFQVWAGPDPDHMTERVSPRNYIPLVYLPGADKWMKIGMPYEPSAPTQPVLRRWSFFTWLRSAAPPAKRK